MLVAESPGSAGRMARTTRSRATRRIPSRLMPAPNPLAHWNLRQSREIQFLQPVLQAPQRLSHRRAERNLRSRRVIEEVQVLITRERQHDRVDFQRAED